MQLCRTIRSVRADGRLFKRCRLPAKLMAEHRLSTHQLLRWLQSEESEDASTAVAKQLREIIYELASTAHLHLETAHKHLQELCPSRAELRQQQLQSLQLFIMPPKRYLELLQRNEFDLIVSGKRLPEFDLLLHWRFLRETFV
jgi:hypothetical protein